MFILFSITKIRVQSDDEKSIVIDTENMSFESLVTEICESPGLSSDVPGFDPKDGNRQVKLFLLEAPGPEALGKH